MDSVKDLRVNMGLTQGQTARYFRVGLRTWKRWEANNSAPFAVTELLRLLNGSKTVDDLKHDNAPVLAFTLFKQLGYGSATQLVRKLSLTYRQANNVIDYLVDVGAIGEPVLHGGLRPLLVRTLGNRMSQEIKPNNNTKWL